MMSRTSRLGGFGRSFISVVLFATAAVVVDRGGNPNCATPPCLPSPPVSFEGSAAGPGIPPPVGDDGAIPCADFDTNDTTCFNDHPFTVPTPGPSIQNDNAVIHVEWVSPGDWDMKVFLDENQDGTSVDGCTPSNPEPCEDLVGSSGQGVPGGLEQTTISPLPPGKYVVRVQNWSGGDPYTGEVRYFGPDPFQPAETETWTLTCERPEGNILSTQPVLINRGQQRTFNFTTTCGQGPTGVETMSFAARSTKQGVTVSWRTANEANLAGFNLWRAGKKLNRGLIAAKRSGTAAGAAYRFVDRSARAGAAHTYRLQAVARDGARALLGRATVRAKR